LGLVKDFFSEKYAFRGNRESFEKKMKVFVIFSKHRHCYLWKHNWWRSL